MKLFAILLTSMISIHSYAQDTAKASNWDIGLEGMVAVSVGKEMYGFNAGGPSFNLRLNKMVKIGVGAFPSFYVRDGKPGAKLSVGPRIEFKKLVLMAPCYYFESNNKWLWTFGLGYKFHAK